MQKKVEMSCMRMPLKSFNMKTFVVCGFWKLKNMRFKK